MTIPNLPTDNYYKFLALSGVVIAITCAILFLNQMNTLDSEVNSLGIEVSQSKLEKKFLEEDYSEITNQIKSLGSYDTVLAKSNLDSMITEYFKKNLTSLQTDKNTRDFYEFMFKYEDKIIPIGPKVQKIKASLSEQTQIKRKLDLKIVTIEEKLKIIRHKKNYLLFTGIGLVIFCIIGIRIASKGFVKWYNLVQKPSDDKLALEIKELRNKK